MSKHLKRLAAPRSWVIPRKTNVYTTKPRAGAHPLERALPLGTVVRDFLKLAATGREAARVIGAGDVTVDGRIVKDAKFAVGFMDVVAVPKTKQAWRVFIDDKARLRLVPIEGAQAGWKLAQITGKTTVSGGRTQLNFHDGRNLLIVKLNLEDKRRQAKLDETAKAEKGEPKVQKASKASGKGGKSETPKTAKKAEPKEAKA